MLLKDKKEFYGLPIEEIELNAKKYKNLSLGIYFLDFLLCFILALFLFFTNIQIKIVFSIIIFLALFITLVSNNGKLSVCYKLNRLIKKYGEMGIIEKKINLENIDNKHFISCLKGGPLSKKDNKIDIKNIDKLCLQNFEYITFAAKIFTKLPNESSNRKDIISIGLVQTGLKVIYVNIENELPTEDYVEECN